MEWTFALVTYTAIITFLVGQSLLETYFKLKGEMMNKMLTDLEKGDE